MHVPPGSSRGAFAGPRVGPAAPSQSVFVAARSPRIRGVVSYGFFSPPWFALLALTFRAGCLWDFPPHREHEHEAKGFDPSLREVLPALRGRGAAGSRVRPREGDLRLPRRESR